ncbi:hypothetical protein MBEHAL_2157 [Halarchaeum acidiphilum MH1-52-1]|uniref:DUF7511 domain-containing protein n=1 Tax=Halarchaeum acidiphilum MH1-52-1 TaxID=1261545 RepID=U2YX95_9EURY|nr:hypothetical protein [Halarchaeum acidiphilum]GAD53397.1 hypothetical protein MBEHAL_2157 [Halarchaeum acidiphilum MH1-52-1]
MTPGCVADAASGGDLRLPRETETWPEFDLACRVEEYDDGVQCTIYPDGADDDTLVTTWLTAEDDAFVDLESAR